MPWCVYAGGYLLASLITFRVFFVTSDETREEFFKDEEGALMIMICSLLWPICLICFVVWGTGHLLTFPTRKQRREIKAKKAAAEVDSR